MRDESEIQEMADKAIGLIQAASPSASTDYLRGIEDALDWVLDETEESPL